MATEIKAPPEDQPGEDIDLAFTLGEYGWASMCIELGEKRIEIGDFGYLTDPLGDLVRSALHLTTGGWQTEIWFDGEPQCWGILIDHGWQSILWPPAYWFRVMHTPDGHPSKPMWQWEETLIEGRVTADAFASAVEKAAVAVLREFGEEGYQNRWLRAQFPTRGLAALHTALSLPAPPRLEM